MKLSGPTKESTERRRAARVVAAGSAEGQRIDNFLIGELRGVPRSRIYRMIRKGEVRVNGGRVKATYRLQADDRIRIPPVHQPAEGAPRFVGERMLNTLSGAILYEDDTLIVVDKPAGLPVHGGSGVSLGAIEILRRLRPDAQLSLVHRLDRDTSGCLLVAKRRSRLRALHEALRQGLLEKRYRLIVHGRWPGRLAEVDTPLQRVLTASGERRVHASEEGKPSLTRFRVLERSPAASLLEAELVTGRTHQIRVHALTAGHPILGDEKYGPDAGAGTSRRPAATRLCLHAHRLLIRDAAGGVSAQFEAPVPGDFQAIWEDCRARGSSSGVSYPEHG